VKRVAVIGAGWAGLACAMELAAAGRAVTVFEAARQAGGRARGVDWHGLRVDNGQHLMVGAYRETLRLMRQLRTEALCERRPLDLRVPGFRLCLPRLPEPLHLAVGLLRARGLSLRDKLGAVRFIESLRTQQFQLGHDQPAATFLSEHGQSQQIIDKLWAPICVAALNTPLALASAQVFCNVLRDSLMGPRADSDLVLNRADLGRLFAEPAVAFIRALGGEVHLASKIGTIEHCDGRFLLHGPQQSFRSVVIASHPARVPALLSGLPRCDDLAMRMTAFGWQPILNLWLRFAAPLDFPLPMLGLPGAAMPWVFERHDLGAGVVVVVFSADGPHLQLPQEQLLQQSLAQLAEVFGPLPKLLDWLCIVEKRATYACTPDLDRPGNATPLAGLFLAGDYTAGPYPATLEGAVKSGVECARLILAS
jgi:squalene-associated FAD-dependent desaturase